MGVLNDNIKLAREVLNMTLEDVAKKVGVSRQTIQKYESGVINDIPYSRLVKLADALHTTPNSLLGWESEESRLLKEQIEKAIFSNSSEKKHTSTGEPIEDIIDLINSTCYVFCYIDENDNLIVNNSSCYINISLEDIKKIEKEASAIKLEFIRNKLENVLLKKQLKMITAKIE